MSQRLGDLDRKDVASAKAAEWASKTHRFREGREGACDPELRAHYAQASLVDGARIATTTDGIGTKVEVAEKLVPYFKSGKEMRVRLNKTPPKGKARAGIQAALEIADRAVV